MSPENRQNIASDRRLRLLTVVGCPLGFILADSVLIPMKVFNQLPAHLTWASVVIIPPTWYGIVACLGLGATSYSRHSQAWLLGLAGFCGLVAVLLAISGL